MTAVLMNCATTFRASGDGESVRGSLMSCAWLLLPAWIAVLRRVQHPQERDHAERKNGAGSPRSAFWNFLDARRV